MKPDPIRPVKPSEQGYVLLTVIFLLVLLTISLSIALPKVTKQIQRDREIETMHRGLQYARAVRLYYKKFGAYPPNADLLFKPTNNIRFLRKKYTDPITGKADWKPIPVGMNKAPTVMGFFGQPLGGVGGCAPTNPSGGNTPQSNSTFGSSSSSPSFGGAPGASADASTNCLGTGLNTNTSDSTGAGGVNPTDSNAANNGTPSGDSSAELSGQTLGGMGIMGFSPNSPKPSIMVYKTKKHYYQWEFVYDPKAEQMMAAGGTGGVGGVGQQQQQMPQQQPQQQQQQQPQQQQQQQ